MTDVLTDEELNKALEGLQIWGIKTGKLATRVEFENYKETVFFANAVFSLAEEKFHHSEVTVQYGAVEIDLCSHEGESVTRKDINMAEKIEKRLGKMN
jgi:Pterin-4a-carbinolamine dehydratase